jgi:PAS domain S-box-containing protein
MAASSCGITIADIRLPDQPLIYINDSFERLTGYAARDVVGINCRFLQAEDRHQPQIAVIRAALAAGADCTVTLRNYRSDGALFWNELFMSPIYDGDSRLTHYVGIQTDVTARVEMQAALMRKQSEVETALSELRSTQAMLVHSEKMNALGQMVAGVAHEINNPVSFVNSNLHSLRGALKDLFGAYERLETLVQTDAQRLSEAQRIRQEADLDFLAGDTDDLLKASLEGLRRVKNIVQALRTFSRLDEAERKPANLRETLQSTLAVASAELRDRVRVVLEVDERLTLVCYPAELNQVFLNLIINAAQAIDGKGTLTIRAQAAPEHVIISFTDTGRGMTPDVQARIFDPFFTTKPVGVGTGLGLTIAYKLITDRHKGTITVDSTPGHGTTFTLTLPKDVRP